MVNKLTKGFYNTVLSQTFTPCGNYLVVGDIYGAISVFHLSKLVNQENAITPEDQRSKNTFTVKQDKQINSLITTHSFLIVGSVGEIFGYTWKNVKTNKAPACSWSIDIPNSKDTFDKSDVNCLAFNSETDHLYVGCGDNNIYIFNVETRKIVKVLSGHKEYIHSIALQNQNQLFSGGEDGTVMTWDIRAGRSVHKVEPYIKDKLSRPELGKWIGDLSVNDDWLLCGGGPRLSLWHLRTLNISTVFPIEDKGIHVAEIYQDKIFAGGRSPLFYQMSYNGDVITEIPTSVVTTYSAVHQEEPFQTLCIAGSGAKIDICSNFIYKNLQLYLN